MADGPVIFDEGPFGGVDPSFFDMPRTPRIIPGSVGLFGSIPERRALDRVMPLATTPERIRGPFPLLDGEEVTGAPTREPVIEDTGPDVFFSAIDERGQLVSTNRPEEAEALRARGLDVKTELVPRRLRRGGRVSVVPEAQLFPTEEGRVRELAETLPGGATPENMARARGAFEESLAEVRGVPRRRGAAGPEARLREATRRFNLNASEIARFQKVLGLDRKAPAPNEKLFVNKAGDARFVNIRDKEAVASIRAAGFRPRTGKESGELSTAIRDFEAVTPGITSADRGTPEYEQAFLSFREALRGRKKKTKADLEQEFVVKNLDPGMDEADIQELRDTFRRAVPKTATTATAEATVEQVDPRIADRIKELQGAGRSDEEIATSLRGRGLNPNIYGL